MIDATEVFDWVSHVDDGGEGFANDLATLVEQIAEEAQATVTVQSHSEEYARNRTIEKINELAEALRAYRIE
jgi:ACT domain-containing protein